MSLDEIIKQLIWIIFFAVALTGIYFMLKKLGAI